MGEKTGLSPINTGTNVRDTEPCRMPAGSSRYGREGGPADRRPLNGKGCIRPRPLHPSFLFRLQAYGLIFCRSQFLNINGMLLRQTLTYGRFVKLLTSTEFLHHSGSFKLSLEFLKGALDVFALLHRYYNHFRLIFLFRYYLFTAHFGLQKYAINSYSANFDYDFSAEVPFASGFMMCTVCCGKGKSIPSRLNVS